MKTVPLYYKESEKSNEKHYIKIGDVNIEDSYINEHSLLSPSGFKDLNGDSFNLDNFIVIERGNLTINYSVLDEISKRLYKFSGREIDSLSDSELTELRIYKELCDFIKDIKQKHASNK